MTAAGGLCACSDSEQTNAGPVEPPVDDLGTTACPVAAPQGGSVFYVDPAAGDNDADGSEAAPWQSIQYVVENHVDCADLHGERARPDAPVKGGDTIMLVGAQGHDQEISISGCYNDDWVTIKAATQHEPEVAMVHFRGSAYWRIDGLKLLNGGGGTMVRAEDHGTRGEAHHIQIVNN